MNFGKDTNTASKSGPPKKKAQILLKAQQTSEFCGQLLPNSYSFQE